MEEFSKVSVIMPAYNAELTIRNSIESVLNQTYKNLELIICDDNSDDSTWDIISEYSHLPNVKILKNLSDSKCAAGPRNRAISKAKGRYIAFLDSDDLWSEKKIENQVSYLRNNHEVVISHGNYNVIDAENAVKSSFLAPKEITFSELCYTCGIGCLTVMLDTHRYGEKPYFKEIYKEDYHLWLKILKQTGSKSSNFCSDNEFSSSYRRYAKSISSNKFIEILRQFRVLKHYEKNNIKVMLYILSYCFNGIKKYRKV